MRPVLKSIWISRLQGFRLCNRDATRFIQVVGKDIIAESILEALRGAEVIYSYNDSRFDILFVYSRLGLSLAECFRHRDLRYYCWRNDLYGGFKAVARQLEIERKPAEIDGYEAVRLWWRDENDYEENTFSILPEYNKEDVINRKALKKRLI